MRSGTRISLGLREMRLTGGIELGLEGMLRKKVWKHSHGNGNGKAQ
jgi:hypothetical protein